MILQWGTCPDHAKGTLLVTLLICLWLVRLRLVRLVRLLRLLRL